MPGSPQLDLVKHTMKLFDHMITGKQSAMLNRNVNLRFVIGG